MEEVIQPPQQAVTASQIISQTAAPPTQPPVASQSGMSATASPSHFSWGVFFGFLLAFVFAGLGGYLYMMNSQYKTQLAQVTAQVSQLQIQLQQAVQRDLTLTGPVMNSVYKINENSFVFLDNNGGAWVVDHTQAQFSEFSLTTGKTKGTDGKMPTTLSEWLATEHSIGQAKDVTGAPGTITVKGVFRNDGVLHATDITVEGQ